MENNLQETTPPPETLIQSPKTSTKNWPKIILFIMIELFLITSAVLFGIQLGKNQVVNNQQSLVQPTPSIAQATPTPSSTIETNSLGTSVVSFAKSGGEIYLKHTINLKDPKVEFQNSQIKEITKFYSYDKAYEPQELTDTNVTKYEWTKVLEKDINDATGSARILVDDRLFSFERVPNSESFVFVVEWNRHAGPSNGPWDSYDTSRQLYLYDTANGSRELKQIKTFTNNRAENTYPKISTFSEDNRYVSIDLFDCWNCGGNMPETLLVDLGSLETKNIGKVGAFTWKQNGAYTYKDYVVIECKEPQPGECTQNPESLPLKSGQF